MVDEGVAALSMMMRGQDRMDAALRHRTAMQCERDDSAKKAISEACE